MNYKGFDIDYSEKDFNQQSKALSIWVAELDEEIKQELVDRAYANLSDATSFSLNEAYNAARIKG